MNRKLFCALLLILASCGCRTCDNCCDYLPPVLDEHYTSHGMRSGSVMASNYEASAPIENETIIPMPEAE